QAWRHRARRPALLVPGHRCTRPRAPRGAHLPRALRGDRAVGRRRGAGRSGDRRSVGQLHGEAVSKPGERIASATPAARAAARREVEEKKLVGDGFLEKMAERAEEQLHWKNGAAVVARAWSDPSYKKRLLKDGTAACAELGFAGPQGEYIVVLENTPLVHNAI